MLSLLEMTNVPMTNILEKCSYKSVLTLRKVCHSLRNFIDDSCFKTDLDNIHITIDPTSFSVICQNPNALWTDGVGFAKDWTRNDLKIILKMIQNSTLFYLSVKINPGSTAVLDDFEELLKNRTRPLQTELFQMEGSEVLKVLPYLDSKTLKEISIRPANYETDDQNLDGIEHFLELEQFKNAVKLTIDGCFSVRAALSKFFHLQRISVKLHEISLEELVALKEAFVTSTHMEFFDLNGRGLDENQLEKVFGTAFHKPYYTLSGSQWFFEIRNCKEHVLSIEFFEIMNMLQFLKWGAKQVPENAVVRN